ncbi:MAG: hypothetical protein R2822_21425 [Spirosomataceae bacterium]
MHGITRHRGFRNGRKDFKIEIRPLLVGELAEADEAFHDQHHQMGNACGTDRSASGGRRYARKRTLRLLAQFEELVENYGMVEK